MYNIPCVYAPTAPFAIILYEITGHYVQMTCLLDTCKRDLVLARVPLSFIAKLCY